MSAPASEERNVGEHVLAGLPRRWRVIALGAVLGGVLAIGFSLLQPTQYTATSSVLFGAPGFDQVLFGSSTSSLPSSDPNVAGATNIDLASLPTIAARTAAALHLSASIVQSEISVSGVGQADVAQISATDSDPRRAARLANTYAQQYVSFRALADQAKVYAAATLVAKELAALSPAQRANPVGRSLQNRANQLRVLAALQTGNAQVVQSAGIPTAPSSPNKKRDGLFGVLLGLLLGVGVAVALERLDQRLRDPSEMEQAYGVPVLGTVPLNPVLDRVGIEPLPAPENEAFALLRARVRYFNVDQDLRSLLITSANAGEGKTTVALNLALAEVSAANTKVVLIEADLRRPALAERLGIKPEPGLAEVLSRNAPLKTALREVRIPRAHGQNGNGATEMLAVIPAGGLPPNPTQLLGSRTMVDLLSTLAERFDLIIIDSSPISAVPDAIPLMRLVSGAVIVSRSDVVTRSAAIDLRKELEKLSVPTLGLVANAVPARRTPYIGAVRPAVLTGPTDAGSAPPRPAADPEDSAASAPTAPAPRQ